MHERAYFSSNPISLAIWGYSFLVIESFSIAYIARHVSQSLYAAITLEKADNRSSILTDVEANQWQYLRLFELANNCIFEIPYIVKKIPKSMPT